MCQFWSFSSAFQRHNFGCLYPWRLLLSLGKHFIIFLTKCFAWFHAQWGDFVENMSMAFISEIISGAIIYSFIKTFYIFKNFSSFIHMYPRLFWGIKIYSLYIEKLCWSVYTFKKWYCLYKQYQFLYCWFKSIRLWNTVSTTTQFLGEIGSIQKSCQNPCFQ